VEGRLLMDNLVLMALVNLETKVVPLSETMDWGSAKIREDLMNVKVGQLG